MGIDFNVRFKALNGQELVIDGKETTIKDVVANALCLVKPKKVENVAKQFSLALKIYNSTTLIDITEDEKQLIRDAVLTSDTIPLLVGQILKLLGD